MEVILALLTAVIGLISILVKFLLSPDRKEIKRQERKRDMDEALRKNNTDDISRLMSDSFDRLLDKNGSNTIGQTDNPLPK